MSKRLRFLDSPADPSPDAVRATVSEVLSGSFGWVVTEWFEGEPPAVEGTSVVADEVVLRGADWLDERWTTGGERWKHLALATRAPGLTPHELSTRWRSHAGTAGGVPIPDAAKGLAYVQNHPTPLGACPYDAVNEVWFDDPEALQQRVAWFTANDVGRPDDLFGTTSFLTAIERPL